MSKTIEKILEILQNGAEETAALIDNLFADRYAAHHKFRKYLKYGPKRFKTNWPEWYRKRQIFYSTLNRLKRDGLVTGAKSKKGTTWEITVKGTDKLAHIKDGSGKITFDTYKKVSSNYLVIVAFDIPERERRKRTWIRKTLQYLGLEMLQKSLWAGKILIPEEFIKDLRELDLTSYVHIFSVSKYGTIINKL